MSDALGGPVVAVLQPAIAPGGARILGGPPTGEVVDAVELDTPCAIRLPDGALALTYYLDYDPDAPIADLAISR